MNLSTPPPLTVRKYSPVLSTEGRRRERSPLTVRKYSPRRLRLRARRGKCTACEEDRLDSPEQCCGVCLPALTMRIGSMAFSRHPQPATRVSATRVSAETSQTSGTSETPSVFLGRQLAAHQRRREVAPGEGHLLDVGAGHGVDAMADRLAAQPLVEEAGRIRRQHPQHGGVAAVGAELAEQGVEQPPAQPLVLEIGLDIERVD